MGEETEHTKTNAEARSTMMSLVGLILFAMLAGSAAFCAATPRPRQEEAVGGGSQDTGSMSPFILTIEDAAGRVHAMKVGIIIVDAANAPLPTKKYGQAIREIIVSRLQQLTFEDASKKETADLVSKQVLGALRQARIPADQVLITDFVLQ